METVSGAFASSLNAAERLLRVAGLLDIRNPKPKDIPKVASILRGRTYPECWRHLIRESAFDALLADGSFLMFRETDGGESFCYYPNPYEIVSFDDYLIEIFGVDWEQEKHDPENRKAYYSEVENAEEAHYVVPLRYDYSPGQYAEGRHPAAHMHAGFDTEIRLGARLRLTPLAFTCFIVRQAYPSVWCGERDKIIAASVAPSTLEPVEDVFFGKFDGFELHVGI